MAGNTNNLILRSIAIAAFILLPCRALAETKDAPVLSSAYLLGPVHIDKKYISMTGPVMKNSVSLAPPGTKGAMWVTGFRADVVDAAGAAQSSEYLCHAWVTLGKPDGDDQKLLTISEGLDSMSFPPGFAVRIDGREKADLLAQALNNNEAVDKKLFYKLTLDYVDDVSAQKHKLRPLRTVTVAVMAKDANPAGGSDICRVRGEDIDAPLPASMGGKSIVHFDVPPGRHIYSSPVEKTSSLHAGGTIHYIKLHLHPYGESISLFDKTAGRSLWTGQVKTGADRALLTDVDYYSSAEGIRLDPAHAYEVRAVYNNTTGSLIDAMAVLRVYVSDDLPEGEKP